MPVDVFGNESPRLSINNWLDGTAVILPIVHILLLLTLVISFYKGFIPQPRIRTKLTLATLIATFWFASSNYHLLFGTNTISDWIARWLGMLSCLSTVLIHVELLKSFLELRSFVKIGHLNFLSVVVVGTFLFASGTLYAFLPSLGQVPDPQVVKFYSIGESMLIFTSSTIDTFVFVHLVYLLLKFIKSKRIRTNYTPVQARKIIFIATVGIALSWIACVIYVAMVDKTYNGYCWSNISGVFGTARFFATSFIFHFVSRMNSAEKETEVGPQFERERTLPIFALETMHYMESKNQMNDTVMDSPFPTPTNRSPAWTPGCSARGSYLDILNFHPQPRVTAAIGALRTHALQLLDSPIGSTTGRDYDVLGSV